MSDAVGGVGQDSKTNDAGSVAAAGDAAATDGHAARAEAKATLGAKVDAKTEVEAAGVADQVLGASDTFDKGAPKTSEVAQADGSVVKTDAAGTNLGVTAPAETPDAAYDRLSAEMATNDWRKSEEAATAQAERIATAAAAVPADIRPGFVENLTKPVNDWVHAGGLVDPATQAVSPANAKIASAFAANLDQNSVNAIGNALRNSEDNVPGRSAAMSTLGKIADTNANPAVASSAAKTLMGGPIDGLKDALAGRVDGLSAEKLAGYTDKYGDVASDQRLLGASRDLDPSVRKTLEDHGLRDMNVPVDNSVVHNVLDAAGLVPGLGEPADLLNAGIYGLEGDYKNAGISLGAAAVLGSIGTAARLGGKALGSFSDALTAGAQKLGKTLGKEEGLVYEAFSKHPPRNPSRTVESYGNIAPAPLAGQLGLDQSVQVGKRTRIAADPVRQEFSVFNLTGGKTWHGHTRTWDGLDQDMRGAMYAMGMVDRRGRFLVQ